MTPFTVTDRDNARTIPVPCGKCPNCVKRRVSWWSFRLMEEDKHALSSHFVTLTYDTSTVHITRKGYMSIVKRDVQLFFKRLRKLNPLKIKYYAVGEYGGKTFRPHYHAILFNCEISTIQKAWNQGQVHYGTVTGASVGYCLKYMSKKGRIPMHKNDDRNPEFGLMSKGWGQPTSHHKWWHGIRPISKTECSSISKAVKRLQCLGTSRSVYITKENAQP